MVLPLFKKNNLHECTLEELKSFTLQYPYYSPGHLLYSAKLKEYGNKEYSNEIQKTSLYFNNPLWLDLLLSKQEDDFIIQEEKIKTAAMRRLRSQSPAMRSETRVPVFAIGMGLSSCTRWGRQ